jgi:hypothetical protein
VLYWQARLHLSFSYDDTIIIELLAMLSIGYTHGIQLLANQAGAHDESMNWKRLLHAPPTEKAQE